MEKKLTVLILSFGFIGILSAFGCKDAGKEQKKADPIVEVKKKVEEKKQLVIHYTALPLKKSDSGKAYYKDHFSDEEKEIISKLNRVDQKHVLRPDTLIIPDTFLKDWLLYSPFPLHSPELVNVDKIVLFSYPIQAFAAYEKGNLMNWGPTSLGSKAHKTPTGLHFTNWKSKRAISTVKDEWILPWNFNIMNKQGVGWHQYDMPGYPASHSCLRLQEKDAVWLYSFADQWILKDNENLKAKGTPVIVYGEYPFGERRPWLNLLDDPKANTISDSDLKELIDPYLPEILKQQKIRQEVTPSTKSSDSTILN